MATGPAAAAEDEAPSWACLISRVRAATETGAKLSSRKIGFVLSSLDAGAGLGEVLAGEVRGPRVLISSVLPFLFHSNSGNDTLSFSPLWTTALLDGCFLQDFSSVCARGNRKSPGPPPHAHAVHYTTTVLFRFLFIRFSIWTPKPRSHFHFHFFSLSLSLHPHNRYSSSSLFGPREIKYLFRIPISSSLQFFYFLIFLGFGCGLFFWLRRRKSTGGDRDNGSGQGGEADKEAAQGARV